MISNLQVTGSNPVGRARNSTVRMDGLIFFIWCVIINPMMYYLFVILLYALFGVLALENMPFTCLVAKMGTVLPGGRRVKNIREDAFKCLKDGCKSFDVGVVLLGMGD